MSLASLLIPSRCAVCARPGPTLCGSCRESLPRLGPPLCDRCGSPGTWPVRRCAECAGRRLGFVRARAAVVYDGAVKVFVAAWKERGRRSLAAVAADLVVEVVGCPDANVLVAVPAVPSRARQRGHAPPLRLAEALGERWQIPVAPLLLRERETARQHALGVRERRLNLRGAFVATDTVQRVRACVVDDVYTTGSTASACATALRRAGAAQVEVICLARAIR